MTRKNLLTIGMLHKLLICDPVAGRLWWRKRPVEMFKSVGAAKSWNKRYAGKEALTAKTSKGYKHGGILGATHLAHRVIWAMETGEWPLELDHDNRIKSDNKFINLKETSHLDNMKNLSIRSDNTSGYTGVTWNKASNKWCSQISINSRTVGLGSFGCITAAAVARQQANIKHKFHKTHGKVIT